MTAADRSAAIADLPAVYGEVVRLVDSGYDLPTVADRLGLTPETIPPLLEIAEAKLARLLLEDLP